MANPPLDPRYFGYPQRRPGPDGQWLAQPAPGGGVFPPNAPITGPVQPGLPPGISLSSAVMLPPWSEPPPNAVSLVQTNVAVISVPAGGNQDAIDGATQLAASMSALTGTTVSTIQQASSGSPVALLTYQAVTAGVFTSFGFYVAGANGRQAVQVSIQVAGNTSPGVQENPADNYFPMEGPVKVFVPFQSNEVVTVMVRNLDASSGYLIRARLCGWRY